MNSERPTKVRKSKRTDTIDKPDMIVEMAEPIKREQTEDEGKGRLRQCTVDEIPYDFLPPDKKRDIEAHEAHLARTEAERAQKEANDTKRAKTLLGVFIGAGIGMYVAYLVKDKLFSPTVAAAIESVSSIVDEVTEQ